VEPDEPEDALEPPDGALPLRGVAVPDDELPDERVRPCSPYRTGGWNASIVDDAGVEEDGDTQPDPELDMPPEPVDEPDPLELPPPPPPPLGTAVPLPASLRGTADPVVLPFDVRSWADARPATGRLATANANATVDSLWRVITPPNPSDRTHPQGRTSLRPAEASRAHV
jgi:hypothetical protein